MTHVLCHAISSLTARAKPRLNAGISIGRKGIAAVPYITNNGPDGGTIIVTP